MSDKFTAKLRTGAKAKKATGFRSAASGKVVFAFDFGEFAVRIAVMKIKRNSVEVRRLFAVENREGLSRLDNTNLKAWRTRIQRALSQRNLSADDHIAVCTFGGKYFIRRRIEVPYAEGSDRDGLVANEMSQLLALDPASYVFQNELIEVTGENENKKCSVWAVAMPKELCTAAYELLRMLKFRPLIMDIHANGIRRFFTADEAHREACAGQTVAAIDYGMTHTEISFLRDGALLGSTMIEAGDGRLVAEAKNAVGVRIVDSANQNKIVVSPEDICNILNRAHTTPEERQFAAFIEDWLSKINTAITRFNYEHTAEPVRKVFLYGGSPQLVWLVQYVSMVTRLPASIISDTALFDTETLLDGENLDYAAYLNVLDLALMD